MANINFSDIDALPITRKSDLLKHISQEDIFYKYFGPFSLSKAYNSVFRTDRNPSTIFTYSRGGVLYYTDLSPKHSMYVDCIGFVAKQRTCDYKEAIKIIAKELSITGKIHTTNRIHTPKPLIQKEKLIQISAGKWTDKTLDYWYRYSKKSRPEKDLIKLLESEDIYKVDKLFVDKAKYTVDDCTFAYRESFKGKVYIKIYAPFGSQKWISSIPNHIPFGISNLMPKNKRLIVTKGKKDIISLKDSITGWDIIGTQNENWSAIDDIIFKELNNFYDDMVFFWDGDEPGIKASQDLKAMGYKSIHTPAVLAPTITDPSDYFETYREAGLGKLFQELIKSI